MWTNNWHVVLFIYFSNTFDESYVTCRWWGTEQQKRAPHSCLSKIRQRVWASVHRRSAITTEIAWEQSRETWGCSFEWHPKENRVQVQVNHHVWRGKFYNSRGKLDKTRSIWARYHESELTSSPLLQKIKFKFNCSSFVCCISFLRCKRTLKARVW